MFSQKVKRERREAVVRASLLERLKDVVQSLLRPAGGPPLRMSSDVSQGLVIGHSDNTNILCNILEAIFIHGLKDSFGEKMSLLFLGDPDRMPVPNFWPAVLVISHRDLIEQVEQLTFISSEVGKGRAWVRLALNERQIVCYLSVLSGDSPTLRDYYRNNAFLRDQECCDIMVRVLQPLSSMNFNLAINAAVLNTWTLTPLILAGLWAPSISTQAPYVDPVMAATDVVSTAFDYSTRGIDIPEPEELISDVMFQLIIGGTPDTDFIGHTEQSENNAGYAISVENLNDKTAESGTVNINDVENVIDDNVLSIQDEMIAQASSTDQHRHTNDSNITDDCSLNRSISIINDAPEYDCLFSDLEVPSAEISQIPSLLIGGLTTMYSPSMVSSYQPEVESTNLDVAKNLNFEVLPRPISLIEDSAHLLPLLTTLTTEEGLDNQLYQCNSCEAYVGMIYGKPRVCSYDSKYYCNDCHEGETSMIPARIIHNWDLTPHPVCIANRKWLLTIYHQPLINIRVVNPRIYRHVEHLAEMEILRRQLLYLRAYLLTCKSGVEQELRKKLWPREYLYEHVHLYSVFDLQLLSTGHLVPSIRKTVIWGRNHVTNCPMCAPRGFICEVCNKDEIIYPFQIGATQTCTDCFAVYHTECSRNRSSCLRCYRIKIRRETKESSLVDVDT